MFIMRDKDQLYLEEGLNMLNLILVKTRRVPNSYTHFFPLLMYPFLGIPQPIINKQVNISVEFGQILTSLSEDIDKNLLENCFSIWRNYIAILRDNLKNFKDFVNQSFLDLTLNIVECIHGNQGCNQTDRTIILTLYVTLIEHRCLEVNQHELGRVLGICLKGLEF